MCIIKILENSDMNEEENRNHLVSTLFQFKNKHRYVHNLKNVIRPNTLL